MTRDAKDYAIEHAGYLAKSAEVLLEFLRPRMLVDAGSEYIDHVDALRSAIYEFRKRAERAAHTSGQGGAV